MLLIGNYPFTTYVRNFFEPQSEDRLNVRLKVTFYPHYCYYDKNNNFIAAALQKKSDGTPTGGQVFIIDAGMSLAFPLFFGDETIVIELDPNSGTPRGEYHISAGAKAKSMPKNLGEPVEGTSLGFKEVNGEGFYMGGTWAIGTENAKTIKPAPKKSNEGWTLTIKKYGPDPESDDVVAGPGTPG